LSQIGKNQNLVPNGSFEEKNPLSSLPDCHHQVNRLKNWSNLNTSDWYYKGSFEGKYDVTGAFFNNIQFPLCNSNSSSSSLPNISTPSGNGYIGMGPCEGVQVKLNSKIPKLYTVTISLSFSLRSNAMGGGIEIYLMKNNAPSNWLDENDGGSCYTHSWPNSFRHYKHFSVPINPLSHPTGTWHTYTSPPFLIADEGIEWLAIKGKNELMGGFDGHGYVYLDDVKLIIEPYCNNYCVPNLGSIEHGTLPETVCSNYPLNYGQCRGFGLLIKNATEVDFSVWDRWGGKRFESISFDPNGLRDPGYTDYLLEWHGETSGGSVLEEDQYVYKLIIRNCSDVTDITRSFTYIPSSTAPFKVPPIRNFVINNCCPENLSIGPLNVINYKRFDANNQISVAGLNSLNQSIPVSVKNGGTLTLVAGSEITLKNGFVVESGGVFESCIAPCASVLREEERIDRLIILEDTIEVTNNYYEEKTYAGTSINNDFKDTLTLVEEKEGSYSNKLEELIIFPNPSSGKFLISKNSSFKGCSISVMNSLGYQIFLKTIAEDISGVQIDLSESPAGIYFIRLTTGSETIIKKIIIN
jgi:hypothetical protein